MGPKLLSFVGRSNSGKTTFITKILPLFCESGLKVGTIKNTHHKVDFDTPGKDSYRHREAGSARILLMTEEKITVFADREKEMSLKEIVNNWFSDFDLVISEGFKNEDCFKVEISRKQNCKTALFNNPDYNIKALISDYSSSNRLREFNLNDVEGVYLWLCQKLDLDS
ncbi:MAG: molybdopterin-guanine dinucleotide biosynthesis protein B [Proteobacteria bacterium]|nr:molybdopterin-guanine dinucleotide biosynthesis protein B [Pseudomonadota bacterium]